MPTNADHLHYYIVSKGRYKRKLIRKDDCTMLILAGAKLVTPAKGSTLYTAKGMITFETWSEHSYKVDSNRYHNATRGKIYFPYVIIAYGSTTGINAKFRAIKHNRCLQCGPLEAYWNTTEDNNGSTV